MSDTPLPINERIRNRREERGLSARDLARRAGFSPSYLSLIEQGQKIPSEKIAGRIAMALDDDPELYIAWARAARTGGDLGDSIQLLSRAQTLRANPEARRRIGSGESAMDVLRDYDETYDPEETPGARTKGAMQSASGRAARMYLRADGPASIPTPTAASGPGSLREMLARTLGGGESRESVSAGGVTRAVVVPLLHEGADPDEIDGGASVQEDILRLDPGLLPPDPVGVFAYRLDASALTRVSWILREGDVAIFLPLRDDEGIDPRGVYAVRHEGHVVLSRIATYDDTLLLTGDDVGPIPVRPAVPGGDWRRLVAGAMVTSIRHWGAREVAPSLTASMMSSVYGLRREAALGRSVRIDGQYLVRDCQWKAGYGWRPVQRPEDMDYLDEHPGMKMRFRLLRGGEQRFVLEMTPEEWRKALGDYGVGESWRRNGYIVAVTKRKLGVYTEQFQDRWKPYVREASD